MSAFHRDVSDWGFFRLRGPDAAPFLQGLVTADLRALPAASWLPFCVLTPKGLLAADGELYAEEGGILAVVRPAAADGFEAAIGPKIILSRSALERARPSARLVFGDGGAAPSAGQASFPWPRFRVPARLVLGGAAPAGAEPMPEPMFQELRLEAGFPWYGADMDAKTLPLEARQEAAVSLDKGCYMGQETVSRQARRGRLTRRLRRLEFPSAAPPAGAAVLAGEEPAGTVTSSAGRFALAMLREPLPPGGLRSGGLPATAD